MLIVIIIASCSLAGCTEQVNSDLVFFFFLSVYPVHLITSVNSLFSDLEIPKVTRLYHLTFF